MANGKVYSGQFLVPLPASVQNGLVDMYLERRSRAGTQPEAFNIRSDQIVLKNGTGAGLASGRVLQIGTKLITDPTANALWFNGSTPAPNGLDNIAITTRVMPANAIDVCQIDGIVLCRLNVNHIQHAYADVDNASTLLQSKWHGRARILWKATASTGEQDALVKLGEMFRGPIKGVAPSGLARGSSATITVHWGGAAASPSSTVTVFFNWMDGGTIDVPTNGELLFSWFPDEQRYVLENAECAH